MPGTSHLTGMQQHVFDNLGEVVMHQKAKELHYDLRGREVSAQIATLVAKNLILRDRQGRISVR